MTGRAEYHPVADLGNALQSHEKQHYPFLNATELPEFLHKLSNYSGNHITLLATWLLMLTGLRTVELRLAKWKEIDFDNRIWEISKTRMKMKRPHVVPLSAQSLSALRQLGELTGNCQLIFAGRNDVNRLMSEASQYGYKEGWLR